MKALYLGSIFHVGHEWYDGVVIASADNDIKIMLKNRQNSAYEDDYMECHLTCDDLEEIQKFAKKNLCNS